MILMRGVSNIITINIGMNVFISLSTSKQCNIIEEGDKDHVYYR